MNTHSDGTFCGETVTSVCSSTITGPFRFSTKYTDGETALVYYGYRYYQAGAGRWDGRDPAMEDEGANLYMGMRNSPITAGDFLGREFYPKDLLIVPQWYGADTIEVSLSGWWWPVVIRIDKYRGVDVSVSRSFTAADLRVPPGGRLKPGALEANHVGPYLKLEAVPGCPCDSIGIQQQIIDFTWPGFGTIYPHWEHPQLNTWLDWPGPVTSTYVPAKWKSVIEVRCVRGSKRDLIVTYGWTWELKNVAPPVSGIAFGLDVSWP